jgi:hypothetical protein
MFVRRRPLLRAAVVGGGAYMAGKRRAQSSAYEAEQESGQDARISELASQQSGSAAATTAQAAGTPHSVSEQLAQLSTLHEQGPLTDSEFASAKSRLLSS